MYQNRKCFKTEWEGPHLFPIPLTGGECKKPQPHGIVIERVQPQNGFLMLRSTHSVKRWLMAIYLEVIRSLRGFYGETVKNTRVQIPQGRVTIRSIYFHVQLHTLLAPEDIVQ